MKEFHLRILVLTSVFILTAGSMYQLFQSTKNKTRSTRSQISQSSHMASSSAKKMSPSPTEKIIADAVVATTIPTVGSEVNDDPIDGYALNCVKPGECYKVGSATSVPQIRFTISGQVFADKNCNAVKDGDEQGVSSMVMAIYKMPEYYVYGNPVADTNGNYSLSREINENESIQLQVQREPKDGYKSHPRFDSPTITFNKDNLNASVNLPVIPYEDVGNCTY